MFGAISQIRMLKTKWSGSKLANGYPAEFGRFLDETRALGFDEIPPYLQYLDMFGDLYSHSGFDNSDKTLDWSPVMRLDRLISRFPFPNACRHSLTTRLFIRWERFRHQGPYITTATTTTATTTITTTRSGTTGLGTTPSSANYFRNHA